MKQRSEEFVAKMLNENVSCETSVADKMAELEKKMTEKIDAMQTAILSNIKNSANETVETPDTIDGTEQETTDNNDATENESNESENENE